MHLDLCRSGCRSLAGRGEITQKETADSFFTMYFNFSSLIVMVFVQISLREDVYLSFDGFVLLEKWVYLCARGGEGRGGGQPSLPSLPNLVFWED